MKDASENKVSAFVWIFSIGLHCLCYEETMSGIHHLIEFYNNVWNSAVNFFHNETFTGLNDAMKVYTDFIEAKSDPRTANWMLAKSPGPLLTILATYLYFCISAGPRFMRDRKPYDLKYVVILHNAVQIFFSIFLVHEGLAAGWANGYSFKCQPVDYSNNREALRMAEAVWYYLICKLIELLDTVFFVLRKKTNQVSFLHVYHHAMMPVCTWIGVTFLPGGHGTLLGCINSFIHIFMYTYYLLSSLGPQYRKYLWWKKYLTLMQMVQFCIICVHSLQLLFRQCDYPTFLAFLLGTQAMYFFYLFAKFYIKAYVRKSKKVQTENNNVANGKLKVN